MNLYVKYSTKKYEWLCFRHATMEAMRGEVVETDVVDDRYFTLMSDSCDFCVAEKQTSKQFLNTWYNQFRKTK